MTRCSGAAGVILLAGLATAGCATHQRLLRQDEEVILNDLRMIQGAEAAFAAANYGSYGTLACLAVPSRCLPGYPEAAPTFVRSGIADLVAENGYARLFVPGPPASPVPDSSAPGSLTGWAYFAVPTRDRRGRKAFCADSTGRICAVPATAPGITSAVCPSPCDRLR